MKDLAPHDRPREKLERVGAAALGDNELLAVVLGSGSREVDVLALATPLLSEHIRKRRGRCGQRPLCRRPHRPAVEHEAKATLSLRDGDLLIEPAPQARPHAAACGLGRVERLVLPDILKDFAHMAAVYLSYQDFT